ncbi:MAG: hypothetical protein AAF628_31960 [Planctomycetota bacterium]
MMHSTEAQLQRAQGELRQLVGTYQFLRFQFDAAKKLIAELQAGFESLSHSLTGDAHQAAMHMEHMCRRWRDRNDTINTNT